MADRKVSSTRLCTPDGTPLHKQNIHLVHGIRTGNGFLSQAWSDDIAIPLHDTLLRPVDRLPLALFHLMALLTRCLRSRCFSYHCFLVLIRYQLQNSAGCLHSGAFFFSLEWLRADMHWTFIESARWGWWGQVGTKAGKGIWHRWWRVHSYIYNQLWLVNYQFVVFLSASR